MRPVIGITASIEEIKYEDTRERAAFVPVNYIRAVSDAGGLPLMLLPSSTGIEEAQTLLDRVDGVILQGGADDVSPATYGQAPRPQTRLTDEQRDVFELALVDACRKDDAPLLGICRGFQVIDVAYGGSLHQHLPELGGDVLHSATEFGGFVDHPVHIKAGSLIAHASGGELVAVRSWHHQAVSEVGEGLDVTGHAPDGTIEAVEDPTKKFLLGVQWHPEEDPASTVIAALVEAARVRASAREKNRLA